MKESRGAEEGCRADGTCHPRRCLLYRLYLLQSLLRLAPGADLLAVR